MTDRTFGNLGAPRVDELNRHGVLNIGNFLTFAILVLQTERLIFVSPYFNGLRHGSLAIVESFFTEPEGTFKCIRAIEDHSGAGILHSCEVIYTSIATLEQIEMTPGKIILDIDADGFCNRNDDSKPCFCSGACCPAAVAERVAAVEAFRNRLIEHGALTAESMALSPGFFSEELLAEVGAIDSVWVS